MKIESESRSLELSGLDGEIGFAVINPHIALPSDHFQILFVARSKIPSLHVQGCARSSQWNIYHIAPGGQMDSLISVIDRAGVIRLLSLRTIVLFVSEMFID
jgi:hypothetical protein